MDADSTIVFMDDNDDVEGLVVERNGNDFTFYVYEDWDESTLSYAETQRLYTWLGRQLNRRA